MNKKRDIFEPREVFKPYEYGEVDQYIKAIQRTYWVHDEVKAELDEDVLDYHSKLTENDKTTQYIMPQNLPRMLGIATHCHLHFMGNHPFYKKAGNSTKTQQKLEHELENKVCEN